MLITKMSMSIIFNIILISSIIIIYFSKEHIKNDENKIYKMLIISNLIGLILHLLCDLVSYYYDFLPVIFSTIILKLYLIYFIFFSFCLIGYLLCISNAKLFTFYKKIFLAFLLIIGIVLFILPQNLYRDYDKLIFYTNGLDVQVVYLISAIFIGFMILHLIINIKKISKKKTIPLLIFIIGATVSTLLQKVDPSLLITDCVETIIAVLMYFTIENPDVKMIEQLNIAKDIADKANNAKTEFLSSMSHEIRTPLNAIMGFSESLKEENLSEKAQEEVNDIISASNSLLEIVNGILDISKIEANKLEIVDSEYDIYKMINELKNLTKARIGQKNIELKLYVDKSLPQVLYGDAVRLKQIILNLLTNAAKYTDQGKIEFNINCVFNQDICRLIISVKDTGRGIKEENINKLFTKFERLDEKNSTIEGTGLGLAITKKLVDLMHGKIVVQSKVNVGSNFMVSIDQKMVANPTLKIEKENIVSEERTNNYQQKKVLIVDDNLLNLKVAVRLLEPYGMNIEEVDNGDDAISKVKENLDYDLILLDDMMPHKSGSETLDELKQIPNFNIPVVVLTANAIEGMKEKYLNMGFDDYLAKPIIKDELKRVLQKYLNK